MSEERAENIICRMYEEGDEQGIVRLFTDTFQREMTPAEWRWKYKGQGNSKVYSAVLQDIESGDIIGHYGGIPARMVHDGREIRGVAAVDTIIHSRHRSFVRFKNFYHYWESEMVKENFGMIYGFSPEKVVRLAFEKLRIYERVLSVFEATKGVTFRNVPVRFTYKLTPLTFDDPEIDGLWNRARHQFGLSVIRDSAYLKWRYGECPLFSYHIWGIRRRWSSKLAGLIVTKRTEHRGMCIMDTVFIPGTLEPLLIKAENLAHSLGSEKLSLWLPHQYHGSLQKLGFTLADPGSTMGSGTHQNVLRSTEISRKFFYTMGDTDYQ